MSRKTVVGDVGVAARGCGRERAEGIVAGVRVGDMCAARPTERRDIPQMVGVSEVECSRGRAHLRLHGHNLPRQPVGRANGIRSAAPWSSTRLFKCSCRTDPSGMTTSLRLICRFLLSYVRKEDLSYRLPSKLMRLIPPFFEGGYSGPVFHNPVQRIEHLKIPFKHIPGKVIQIFSGTTEDFRQ